MPSTVLRGLAAGVGVAALSTGLALAVSAPAQAQTVRPDSSSIDGTISAAEGEHQIAAFLDEHPEFTAESVPGASPGPFRQTLPDRDGTDGFFIARLVRT